MAKFQTIMLLSKKTAGANAKKPGSTYYSCADVKPNESDPSKLDFKWLSTVRAFPTKSGGISICRIIEE